MDLEALGGAATGGLVAQALERPAGRTGEHRAACADCGTETIGRFCHNCGNASHVHRTLLHLGEELLHGVMHFDSRTWRTLPLLAFRPGKLTREWCLGRRTRYVSPLAIFLFTVFVMFMALHYLPAAPARTVAQQRAAAEAAVVNHTLALRRAQQNLAAATTEEAKAEAREAVKETQGDVAEAQKDAAELNRVNGLAAKGDWKEALAEQVQTGKLKFNTGRKDLDAKLVKKALNPELTVYELQQAFYKFSFLLVPISIPFVALLFLWKKGFTLYDHGVFVLYSLTFASLLIMAMAGLARLGGSLASSAVEMLLFAMPAHMFFQLKGAYGLKVGSALWRTLVLLVFSFIALALFVTAIVWMELA
jgi:hypothetical protein